MIISANRILQTKSLEVTSPQAAEMVVTTPAKTLAKTLSTVDLNKILNPKAIVPVASPATSSHRTTELPAIVKATEGISQGGSDRNLGMEPAGHLGIGTAGDLPAYNDPDSGFEKPGIPVRPDWLNPVRVPGGEASDADWADETAACIIGGAAGAVAGLGVPGAAVGCLVGIVENRGQDQIANALRAWFRGGPDPDQVWDVYGPDAGALSEDHDMGVPTDPARTPTEDETQGSYSPKFAPPSLSWLSSVKPRPSEGDPIGIDTNEPANVINILRVPTYGPAVDGNPDTDPNYDGAASKAILTTSDAVTDPRPDLGIQLQKLNDMRLANLRG